MVHLNIIVEYGDGNFGLDDLGGLTHTAPSAGGLTRLGPCSTILQR